MAAQNTLCFIGIEAADEVPLKEAFVSANMRLKNRWAFANEAVADVLLIDVDSLYGHMAWLKLHHSGRPIVALSRTDKAEADYLLNRPITVDKLLAVLEQLATKMVSKNTTAGSEPRESGIHNERPIASRAASPLSNRPAVAPQTSFPAPEPVPEPVPPRAPVLADYLVSKPFRETLNKSLLDFSGGAESGVCPDSTTLNQALACLIRGEPSLARGRSELVQASLSTPVRYTLAGSTPLVLDFPHGEYLGPATLKHLLPYCRCVIRPQDWVEVLPEELGKLRAGGNAFPFSRLLWLCALVAGEGQLAEAENIDRKFRLVKWPQIEREYPRHFRIATAMMKQPATLTEIAVQSGASEAEVADFINAYRITGFVETEELTPVSSEPATTGRGKLLGLLRGLRTQ